MDIQDQVVSTREKEAATTLRDDRIGILCQLRLALWLFYCSAPSLRLISPAS